MLYLFAFIVVVVLIGFFVGHSPNGLPMRPVTVADKPAGLSPRIRGVTADGTSYSCSFVEFDERGDFLDFAQHKLCQDVILGLAKETNVLLVIYCHGWKNNSQSGDVVSFNSFLSRLATSNEIKSKNLRVHGVYLGWRGNVFRPYVNTDNGIHGDKIYQQMAGEFGEPVVESSYLRFSRLLGMVQENLSYWNRKAAAESKVSGLPIARAIFTYASSAKRYGLSRQNRVCVIGHSFGALLLERSLGQAMTGALTMEWWTDIAKSAGNVPAGAAETVVASPSVTSPPPAASPPSKLALPFDMILFVNSAAPAIYAKEMRDFLKAHRSALVNAGNPAPDLPVIVSLTSTADWATGALHPLGNILAPFDPSLKRQYTTGIFGLKPYPRHSGIRQSKFYTKTPGHSPYLINHWIVKASSSSPSPSPQDSSDQIFTQNLAGIPGSPDVFWTSRAAYPAAAWSLTTTPPPGKCVTLDDLPLSMADSNYWIISCGKELIRDHNDVWSSTAMEMYAGLFRAVESRRPAAV